MTNSFFKTITARPVSNTFRIFQVLFLILAQVVGVTQGVQTALASPVTVVDDGGADDLPGQKDLNFLTIDYTPATPDIAVTWGWDDTQWSGNNTGDACTLFDTDSDGFANYSLCITVNQNGTYNSTRLYSCTADNRSDRCGGPTQITTLASTGNASVQNADPFGTTGRANNDCSTGGATGCLIKDTVASLTVKLSDFGGSAAKLINVCSYPSQEPNSDPSDCVITPNAGFLTIVKVANPDDNTDFVFNASEPSAGNPGVSTWTINGSGSVQQVSYAATTTLDLSEVVPAGWQLDSASCEIQTAPPTPTGTGTATGVDNFTIQSGLETICSFNDSLATGTLTVIKTVVNDNGGSATSDQWSIHVTSGGNEVSGSPQPGSATGTPYTLTAGTYQVGETGGPSGYTGPTFGGDCDNSGSVNVVAGQNKTCTLTNDDNAAGLTLIKHVVNDNGGTAVAGDWTLSAGSNNVTGSETGEVATTQAGTYALSETSVTGYTNTSITCDNDPGVEVTSVTLGLGDTVSCTFVNDDNAPSLTLVKEVINDNGGTAVAGDWTLTASGYDAASPDAGTYNLSESGPAGYTQTSLTCSNSGDTQVTSVTLGLGENVTCTFVNDDQPGTLIVKKVVINDNEGTKTCADFSFSVNSGASTPFEADCQNDLTVNAGTYNITEPAVAGYSTTYSNCSNVAVPNGGSATCTITNNDIPPTVVAQITPTATTCNQFASGTAATLSELLYTVKGGKIGTVSPGVFFYWVKVTAVAGANTFTINQTITTGNFRTPFKFASGSSAWNSNCAKITTTVTQSNGTVTVNFNAASAGTVYIGIKYDSGSVKGATAPIPTTVHYDFSTTGVPGSTQGLDLKKK